MSDPAADVKMVDAVPPAAPAPASGVARIRKRAWCITCHLGVQIDDDLVHRFEESMESAMKTISEDPAVQCFVCQLEAAESTGRHHLQAFIMFHNARGFKGMVDWWKALFGADAAPHVEPSRAGNPQQAWDYCTKDDTRVLGPWSSGERPKGAGARADIQTFVDDAKGLKDGSVTLLDLQENHVRIEAQYMKYFDRVTARFMPSRSWQTLCAVLCGPPATGKSHRARQLAARWSTQAPYYLRVPKRATDEIYFENYRDNPDVVIIDEFDWTRFPLSDVNNWIDSSPCLVNVKGGQAQFLARIVIITSNDDVKEMYPHSQSFYSRLNLVCQFVYGPVVPDAEFTNRAACATAALLHVVKDDGRVMAGRPADLPAVPPS